MAELERQARDNRFKKKFQPLVSFDLVRQVQSHDEQVNGLEDELLQRQEKARQVVSLSHHLISCGHKI